MRLIDADAYGEEMRERQTACIQWHDEVISSGDAVMIAWVGGARSVFSETKLTLEKMPTIDAVEVVRCKDCKYYLNSNETCGLIDTRLHSYLTDKVWTEDSFCSWGERRTHEAD